MRALQAEAVDFYNAVYVIMDRTCSVPCSCDNRRWICITDQPINDHCTSATSLHFFVNHVTGAIVHRE